MWRFLALSIIVALSSLCGTRGANLCENFNKNWRFALSDTTNAPASPDFDDSKWRKLNLPHDWAIEGEFSALNPSGAGGGALPGGIGWYRKSFTTNADDGEVFLDFDGAYMNASVYINGHYLGTRPYGYAPFSYEITPWLKEGNNIVAVRVDNAEQPNSRWYSGCGIYRNVWLRHENKIHIPQWGQHIVATTGKKGTLAVTTTIRNNSDLKTKVKLNIRVKDASGKTIAKSVKAQQIAAKTSTDVKQQFTIASPELWSIETPYLYSVETELVADKVIIDRNKVRTGFRDIKFDAEHGFALNDKNLKINGVCLHHDAGALGAVVNRRAIERQLQIMHHMGANAVRCSHNPPSPELLELCDSMGILVMDESFDMWRKQKTAHDYARYFDEWHERDLRDLVLRDRNHPCIIMWSIGNEVLEQWSSADADTLSLEQANLILNFGHSADMLAGEADSMSVNSLLTIKLAEMVRKLDSTRPITAGCNEPSPGNHLFRSNALDIIGFNYHHEWADGVPTNFPGKPFLFTESVSALATRGYYSMPADSMNIWPIRWDIPFETDTMACSAYDNCHVPWGSTHAATLKCVEDNDFIMGQFVWTGFDYIGEPTPFSYPARSSFFGLADLAGFPKDAYYLYQSRWNPTETVLHLFPHWNWAEGQQIDMRAYFNNADEVELFVNGRSAGVRSISDCRDFAACWRVTFEKGSVVAVSRKDGHEVARAVINTAEAPAAIRLTPDRSSINADGTDLCYITAEVVDANGNICPLADNEITFKVEGAGYNAGVDNGSPISTERFKADSRHAMAGKALLIVQNNGNKGQITITASAPLLKTALKTITAE